MINLQKIFQENYKRWKTKEYIFEKKEGVYQAVTYGWFMESVQKFAEYLLQNGWQNKSVIIYGPNSKEWMVADLAVLAHTGISVGVSNEWKYEDVKHTIEFLKSEILVYDIEKEDVVNELKREFPELHCICMQKEMSDVTVEEAEAVCVPQAEDTCCKIVFSSGTTADPKGVMLSLKNIFFGYASLTRRCPFNEEDVDYLFLPLSHTYGGIYNFLYSLISGYSIYLCSGMQYLSEEIREVSPTIFCGVPLVYRRFYEAAGENLKYCFGNRIAYLFCGGASFDKGIRKAYHEAGLNMMEAYALSETASSLAIAYPFDKDFESSGTIFEDIEVKVQEPNENGIGEILVRGDNVFLGYVNAPEETKRCFTSDGFFKTGDLGYLSENKVYITGRNKKILIGENGENVDAEELECLLLKKDNNINAAKVFLKDNMLCCSLYLKEETDTDWDAFWNDFNKELPKYKHIKNYKIYLDNVLVRLKQ